jgi:tetratricopeptide (TPR) repeat protein
MKHGAWLATGITVLVAVAIVLAWHLGGASSSPPPVIVHAKITRTNIPALPAPKVSPSSSPSESLSDQEPPTKALLSRLEKGIPQLTLAQLQGYLEKNHRSAESLLTAARLAKDLNLLREAARLFPNDPRVQFELATQSTDATERQKAFAAMAENDPDNALGCYLAAAESLKAGKSDDAVRWLTQANERGRFDDYMMANVQATEEALLATGTPPLDAKALATFGASLPHLTPLRDMSKQVLAIMQSYSQSGDANSSQAMLDIGLSLGGRLQDGSGSGRLLINDLVGLSIERQFLRSLDPNAMVPGTQQTAAQRLEANNQRQHLIKHTNQGADFTALSPQDLSLYMNRLQALGELAAMQWLRNRLGLPPEN